MNICIVLVAMPCSSLSAQISTGTNTDGAGLGVANHGPLWHVKFDVTGRDQVSLRAPRSYFQLPSPSEKIAMSLRSS